MYFSSSTSEVTHTFVYGNKLGTFKNERSKTSDSKAYSGSKDYYNDEKYVDKKSEGPIPPGKWEVTEICSSKGPLTCRLSPCAGTATHGRSGFLIHGDNSKMDHTASEGCIITKKDCRQDIQKGDFVQVN